MANDMASPSDDRSSGRGLGDHGGDHEVSGAGNRGVRSDGGSNLLGIKAIATFLGAVIASIVCRILPLQDPFKDPEETHTDPRWR